MVSKTNLRKTTFILAAASLAVFILAAVWTRYLYEMHRGHIIDMYLSHQEELVLRVAAMCDKKLAETAARMDRIASSIMMEEGMSEDELATMLSDRLAALSKSNIKGLVLFGESGPPMAEAHPGLPQDWPAAKLWEFINSTRGELHEQADMSQVFSIPGPDQDSPDFAYSFIAVPVTFKRVVGKKVVVTRPPPALSTNNDEGKKESDAVVNDEINKGDGGKQDVPGDKSKTAAAAPDNKSKKESGGEEKTIPGKATVAGKGTDIACVDAHPAENTNNETDAADSEPAAPPDRVVIKRESIVENGFLVALTDLREFGQAAQMPDRKGYDSLLFMLSDNGLLLSHPDPNFIGADSTAAFSLSHYVDFDKLIQKMKKGEIGDGVYYSPDTKTGSIDTKWMLAYAPIEFGGRVWSVGAAFEIKSTPFLAGLAAKYSFSALFLLVVLVAANLIIAREKRRLLDTDRKAVKLGDTAALNEILTSVNSELTEEKRKLEVRTEEFHSIIKEREADIEKMDMLFEKFVASVNSPSRKQRNIVVEVRNYLKILRRPIESRFHKKK